MELDELRRRKIAALQDKNDASDEEAIIRAKLMELERIARARLTPQAYSRYTNIKLAHPDRAVQVLVLVAELARKGYEQIGDGELRQLLIAMEPSSRKTTIRRV